MTTTDILIQLRQMRYQCEESIGLASLSIKSTEILIGKTKGLQQTKVLQEELHILKKHLITLYTKKGELNEQIGRIIINKSKQIGNTILTRAKDARAEGVKSSGKWFGFDRYRTIVATEREVRFENKGNTTLSFKWASVESFKYDDETNKLSIQLEDNIRDGDSNVNFCFTHKSEKDAVLDNFHKYTNLTL